MTKVAVIDTEPEVYGKEHEYCIYYLEWHSENHYDLSFSCGRIITGLSRYTNKFKRLDSGASRCKCGRIASQGELG